MRKSLLFALALLSISFIAQSQTRRYVNHAATGTNNGSSWVNAYSNLQTAIASSAVNDTLWIAEGTYKPHATDVNTSFSINGLVLYGGFAGGEGSVFARNILAHPTILSGDLSGNDAGF